MEALKDGQRGKKVRGGEDKLGLAVARRVCGSDLSAEVKPRGLESVKRAFSVVHPPFYLAPAHHPRHYEL